MLERDPAAAWLALVSVCVACCARTDNVQASGNVILAATSDYDFRGETQTGRDPAAQITLEWLNPTGWKAGLFASNVSFGNSLQFGDPRLELAPYVDFKKSLTGQLRAGSGAAYYSYLVHGGNAYDFAEAYLALEYRSLRCALYYAPDYGGQSTPQHTSGWYTALDGSTAVSAHWALLEHAGYSWGEYWNGYGGGRRLDYSLGVVRRFGRTDLSAVYLYTQRMRQVASDPGSSGRALLAVTHTMSW